MPSDHLSATPAQYELQKTEGVAGAGDSAHGSFDPVIEVKPTKAQVQEFTCAV